MAFCVKCGKELPDSAKFCTSCGAPVNKKQTPGKEEQLAEEKERTVPVQESEQDAPAAQTAEETGGAPLEEPMEAPKQAEEAPEEKEEAPKQVMDSPEETVKSSTQTIEVPKQKQKSKTVPIIAILVAAVLIVVGGFFGFRTFKINKEYKEQMAQAEEYVEDGEYRKAGARYKAALELKPKDEAAALGQAEMYLRLEDFEKAEKAYRAIVDQKPNCVEGLRGLADAYLGLGKYDAAEENYQAALDKEPENLAALLGMAKLYADKGDAEKAEESYRAVLALDSKQMDAVLGLADFYLRQGDYTNTGEILKTVHPGPGDEGYSRYQYLQSMAEFRPEIKKLDASGFPEMAVTFQVNGGQRISWDQVEIMENGVYCGITDWNETPNGIVLYYTAEKASQSNEERVVTVSVNVDELTFEVEERYTAVYGPDILEQFAGTYQNVEYSDSKIDVTWDAPWVEIDAWDMEWFSEVFRFNANFMTGYEFNVYENSAETYANYFDSDISGVRFIPAATSAYGADTVIIEWSSWRDQVYVREGGSRSAGGYLLPTDREYITEADLRALTQEEVVLARNEIYARYGYDFQAENIREYFAGKSWYSPNPEVNASTFGTAQMNEYEKANLELIQNYEKAMGWK